MSDCVLCIASLNRGCAGLSVAGMAFLSCANHGDMCGGGVYNAGGGTGRHLSLAHSRVPGV